MGNCLGIPAQEIVDEPQPQETAMFHQILTELKDLRHRNTVLADRIMRIEGAMASKTSDVMSADEWEKVSNKE